MTKQKETTDHWQRCADGCPWRETTEMYPFKPLETCSGNNLICQEGNCAPYHFIKQLGEDHGE